MTNFDKVRNFHLIFQRPIRTVPTLPSMEERMLRLELIEEETDEFNAALRKGDLVAAADALGDLLYVTYGACVEFGIDADKVLAEIHRSNMTKLDADGKAILREDGKVLKGPNYEPPNLKAVLKADTASKLPSQSSPSS